VWQAVYAYVKTLGFESDFRLAVGVIFFNPGVSQSSILTFLLLTMSRSPYVAIILCHGMSMVLVCLPMQAPVAIHLVGSVSWLIGI